MDSRIGYCILLLHLSVGVLGYTPIDYIDSYCGQTIQVTDAVRIKLRSSYWPSSSPCTVTLQGSSLYHLDSNTRILLRFRAISFSCTKGYVDILDSDGTTKTGGSQACGYSTPWQQPWKSTGNTMTIRLKKLSTFSFSSGSFDILATQFTTGVCDFSEFDCWNGRCIDDSLTCDSRDNCGDDSDELTTTCYNYTGWSSGVTGGVAFGGIFFFVFFVVLFAGIYRRRTYGYYWRSGVPYRQGVSTISTSTTTVGGGAVVASSQYGVQTPAPVYTSPAPPPPYPQTQYPQTQYPGVYPR